jgi:hypothetical protein
MKKIAASFICFGFLFCASVCSAAYLIHLKDGREILTHEYWEEGGQIKIKQSGGDVLSIEESDDVRTVIVKSPPEKEPETEVEKAEAPPKKEEKAGESRQSP